MSIYSYKALTSDGRATSGTVEAASRREASDTLRSRGVHVTSMRVSEGYAVRARRRLSPRKQGRTHLFTSFMRRLLRAGMPVVDALDAAASELEDYDIGEVIARVRDRVAGGSALAEALAHEREFFDDLYVAMVRAAEASGALTEAFDTIYRYQRRKRDFRKRVFSALAYPMVLVTVSILAVAFLLGYVVPKIEETLVAARIPLPLVTRVVIGAGDIAQAYWPVLLGLVLLAVIGLKAAASLPAGRMALDKALLKLPLICRLARGAAVSRFSRTLAALLKSGLRVADALETAGEVSGSAVYESAVSAAHGRIVSGGDLAGALGESGLFPGYALQIVAIGERTGTLADSFEEVANSEEEALETTTELALTLLEPAIIVIMAVVVGFIVASVLLPILSLSNIA